MSQTTLENRVQDLLRNSLEQYQTLNELADQMLGSSLQPDQWHATAEKMKQISVRLEQMEHQNQSTTTDYRQGLPKPSAAISALKDQLATQMQTFLMKVSRLEQQAVKSKQALLPQIHDSVRAVQMKQAYGKFT